MKSIFLVRHAKAEFDSDNGADFDRQLTDKGNKTAKLVGRYLKIKNIAADMYVSSPAARAWQTGEIFLNEMAINSDNLVPKEIFYFDLRNPEFIEFIHDLSDEINSIMIFGHEPLCSNFSELLSGDEISGFPKAGIIQIDYKVKNWNLIKPGAGKIQFFYSPAHIRNLQAEIQEKISSGINDAIVNVLENADVPISEKTISIIEKSAQKISRKVLK